MKKTFSLLAILLLSVSVKSQNTPNPYASIGKPAPKMATLSNGAYDEFLLKQPLVLINSDAIDRKTGEMVYSKEENPEMIAKLEKDRFRFLSIDPLSTQFPYLTPYQYAANTPIAAIDLDGLENVYVTAAFKDGSELMQVKFTAKHIQALKQNGAVPFKIYYLDKDGKEIKSTGQFEGPNKQNELKIFQTAASKLNCNVCNEIETDNGSKKTEGLNSAMMVVPKPSPPKVNLPTQINAAGIAKFGNLNFPTAGVDFKGDPAGPGALGGLLVSDLDQIIKSIKTSGNINSIDLNLTFSYNSNQNKDAVELSAKNGIQNVKNYLSNNGLKDVNINTSYKLTNEADNGGKSTSNLDIIYK